jgi:hypothetical protein
LLDEYAPEVLRQNRNIIKCPVCPFEGKKARKRQPNKMENLEIFREEYPPNCPQPV